MASKDILMLGVHAKLPLANSCPYKMLNDAKIHPKHVKPSHHWVTHIFEQLEDYGPVYGFWTFIFKHLNKVLKSYSTNNHGDGEIEISFFRAFLRDTELRTMLTNLLTRTSESDELPSAEDAILYEAVKSIIATDSDTRGTVASLASEIDDIAQQAGTHFSLSLAASSSLHLDQQKYLLHFYQTAYLHAHIVSATSYSSSSPNFLSSHAQFHNYAIVDGHHIVAFDSRVYAPNSIVQAEINNKRYVGQVHLIITHWQKGVDVDICLLEVHWFQEAIDFECRHWTRYPELEIYFWDFNKFLDNMKDGPSRFIPIGSILSQACRLKVMQHVEDPKINKQVKKPFWVTIGLTRDVQVV
ncbi:hypothetical protein F4604DRAFT_1922240 [Suillus subluteus]|nr:hypothetical protein F4604DRAFT_1922240 [Suillus subluteus]